MGDGRHSRAIGLGSPVIVGFCFACLVVLGLDFATDGSTTDLFFSTHGFDLGSAYFYIGLVGHVLGHGGWRHLFNNVLMLLLVGPHMEERYGHLRLLCLMLLTAVVTGLVAAFMPHTRILGASGIVFMLVLLSAFTRRKGSPVPVTAILVAAFYLFGEVVDMFTPDNISQMAHLVGGLIGATAGYLMNKSPKGD